MVTPNINTDAINTKSIIDMKIRDRKDTFFSKSGKFDSKLANIAPKKVQEQESSLNANPNLVTIKLALKP